MPGRPAPSAGVGSFWRGWSPGGSGAYPRAMNASARAVHRFWFGELDEQGLPGDVARARWFRGGASFDRTCEEAFGALVERALDGGLEDWSAEPDTALSLVLLLDQLPRNVHRGTPRAFAGDARALAIAQARVAAGDDARLRPAERYFLYMPFEHAEDPAAQDHSVALFERLREEAPPAATRFFAEAVRWAERHREAIRRFGRFPARNAALGRDSTREEERYLAEHPEGF